MTREDRALLAVALLAVLFVCLTAPRCRPTPASEAPLSLQIDPQSWAAQRDDITTPWAPVLARLDLAWHSVTETPLPPIRRLANRWGWSRSTTARFVTAFIPTPTPTVGQSWDNPTPQPCGSAGVGGTKLGQNPAGGAVPPPRAGARAFQSPKGFGRDAPRPSGPSPKASQPHLIPDTIQAAPPPSADASTSPTDFERAVAVLADEVLPVVAISYRTERWSPRRGLGRKLQRRLDAEGLDDVLLVLRWWATSPNETALFLRRRCGLPTLLNPEKFHTWLGWAEAPPPAPEGHYTPPPNDDSRVPDFSDDELREMF